MRFTVQIAQTSILRRLFDGFDPAHFRLLYNVFLTIALRVGGFTIAQKINAKYEEHTYDKYMLNEDFNREQLLEKFPYAKTFPQITIDGIHIGGYTEFAKVCEYLE